MEYIGKVKLNYKFYNGIDSYSDGDIEDDLLQYVKESQDVMDIISKDKRWPVLYHLSPIRQNIIDWYMIDKESDVLEVGSGCGAVTGALCKKAKSVTCIELSKRRSLVNAYRNHRYDNLEIMVGNFNDVKNGLGKKFDYITLIGVLEYAKYYTAAENPFVVFLENIKSLLKPNGKLLIAIENKYGLKYWAGAREDHTGKFFDGLEGYGATKSEARTFSKQELSEMLKKAGYVSHEFYYPFPDYKFPQQIFSDDWLPKEGDLVCSRETYDSSRLLLFDETAVYNQLIQDGMFDIFANSFFVECNIGGRIND